MFLLTKTILIALVGSFIFYFLQIPIPWLLGSLTGVMLWRTCVKEQLHWPIEIRNAGLIIIGYTIGTPFTYSVCQQMLNHLPSMLFVTVTTIFISLLMGYYTCLRTGISLESSLLGSIPGGLSQMVLLSEEIPRSNLTIVTFMQTFRFLSVVFVVPFVAVHGFAHHTSTMLVSNQMAISTSTMNVYFAFGAACLLGAFIAYKVKLPTPFMLGPAISTAALVIYGFTPPSMPNSLITFAQLSMGIFMGVGVNPDLLRKHKNIIPYTFLNVIVVLLTSFLLSLFLNISHSISLLTAFLSLAPGGLGEMSLTAIIVKADISTVVSYQLFRLLFILLIVPLLLKWGLTYRNRKRESKK